MKRPSRGLAGAHFFGDGVVVGSSRGRFALAPVRTTWADFASPEKWDLTEHVPPRGEEACDTLLQKAVDSRAVSFRKRAASGLQSGRSFVLPDAQEQLHDKTDLELVT